MDWLTYLINKEFDNKFSFLKLLEINYDKSNSQCLVIFLYPDNLNISEEHKVKLADFIKTQLNLFAKVSVKFKKSYLDNDIINDTLFDFLKVEYPSIYALSEKNQVCIENNFKSIDIKFDIDATSVGFLNKDQFKIKIKNFLESKFCYEFSISLNEIETKKLDNLIPIQYFKEEIKTPRYEVKIIYRIFGGDIIPKPEFIKNVKTEKVSVILAGKIENFEKKSYESKKIKNKGEIKYYYTFELNDTTAKIEVKYFTSIVNEKRMDKLSNGEEVLILGDIKSFNNKLSLYVKEISKCKLPEKIEIPIVFNDEYECVMPEPYSILSQENLFKKIIQYSKFIYDNTYVVFDVETTGLNYEVDELLEIGAVKIKNGKIVEKFASLVKPKNPIPQEATLINNITNEMVADSPSINVLIRDFYRFTKGSKMVGYNVSFDQKFIQKAAKDQGLYFDQEFIDVIPMAKTKLALTRYKLTDVVKRLEITLEGAHRALADSLATAEIFLELNSENYA